MKEKTKFSNINVVVSFFVVMAVNFSNINVVSFFVEMVANFSNINVVVSFFVVMVAGPSPAI